MDAPLALYRRYRPETFAEVIGQEHVTDPLRAALRANRVNHAYLFSGPRGCGKTTSARILARALNCEQGPIDIPCGECRSCVDLARGGPGSVDVIEIDAASHGGVDDARDLRERAFFAPVASRYKVYIIDEAHMVTTQGFNALLKLVEEPPPHLKFIFATTEPEKVIGTIRSRTHHYPFRLIPPKVLTEYLGSLCQQERIGIEPAALSLVVRAGAGSARDTLSVLDQLMGGAGPEGITYHLAAALLGYTPDSLLDEVVEAFAAHDGAGVFGVIDRVIETGQDPRRFTEDLLKRLRDLLILAAVPDAVSTGLVEVPAEQGVRLAEQSARFGRSELTRAADLVAAGLVDLKGATAPRLLLELICSRVLLPGAEDTTLGLAARLDRLERRLDVVGLPTPSRDQHGVRGRNVWAPPSSAVQSPAVQPPAAPSPATQAPAAPSPVKPPAQAPSGSPGNAGPLPGEPSPRATTPSSPNSSAPTTSERPPEPDRETNPVPGLAAPEPSAPPTAISPTAASAPGAFGAADARRVWPEVVDQVRSMRRATWALISQYAQVVGVEGKVLTLGFKTVGTRDQFTGSGHGEIVRQAFITVIGQDLRVEPIVDPGASPDSSGRRESAPPRAAAAGSSPAASAAAAPSQTPVGTPGPVVGGASDQHSEAPGGATPSNVTPPTPTPTPTPAPAPTAHAEAPQQMPGVATGSPAPEGPPSWAAPGVEDPRDLAAGKPRAVDPAAIAQARQAIASTRPPGFSDSGPDRSADADVDLNDPDAEDSDLSGAALLQQALGASIIDETIH